MKLRNVEPQPVGQYGTEKKRAVNHYDFAKYVENNDWGLFIDTKPDLSRINYGRAKHGQLSFIKLSRKEAFDIYSSSKTVKENNSREIALRMLKRNDKEIQRYKTEGLEKLAPIESFYQNIMRRVLQKSRKKNLKLEKDEHGNFWFVTEITESDRLPIYQYQKLAKEPLKKEKINFDDFLKEWHKTYKDLEPSDNIKRHLRNLFVRLSQNTPKTFLSYNPETGKVTAMSAYNSEGKRVQEMTPIKPHDEINDYKSFELKEVYKDGKSLRPLGKHWRYDMETDSYVYENVLSSKDWRNIYKRQQKRGFYAWSPLKDKGRIIFRPFHPDVGKMTLKETLKSVGMYSPENINWINHDRNQFFKRMGVYNKSKKVKEKWHRIHTGMIKSNILYEPNAPFKNGIDAVKRSTLLSSSDYKLDKDYFKDISDTGKLNVIMVNDVESGRKMPKPEKYKINGKERIYDSDVDGYVVVPSKLFKRIVQYFGLDPTTSRLKPTVAIRIGDKLFLLKGGIHPPREGYEELLHEPNTIIVNTSAGKVHPGKEYLLYDKNGKVHFRDKADLRKKVESPETFEMNIEDLRINPGVTEDKSFTKVPSIKKQLHSFWSSLQVSEEAISEMKNIIDANFMGDKVQNRYVERILADPEMTRPDDFNIKKIGDKEIVKILNSPNTDSWIVKDLYADMINETRYRGFEDEIGLEPDLMNSKSYVNRLSEEMKATNYNPILIRYLEANGENFNDLVLRYRRTKLIYPNWEWGGSGWAGGQDPVTKSKLASKEIDKGTFKLGYSHREMKVKGVHKNLEDLYEKWKAEKNPERKDFLAEELEFALMRVPSPDVSGTRILRFDGFIGKKDWDNLKSYDYGFYGRQEDYYYMDGMDVDGDTVKMWQGFPSEIKKQIKENAKNLEKNGNMKPNKNPKHNETYGSSPPGSTQHKFTHSKISQYLPNALLSAGEGARIGKESMGPIVNAKTFLNQILADALKDKKNKGRIFLPVTSKAGNTYAVITGRVTEKRIKDFDDGYFTHGYEASSRTADSNTFDKIGTYQEIASALAKKGIKNLKVFKWNQFTNKPTKEEIPFEYRMFRSTDYKDLWEANSIMYGREFQNQKITLEMVQNITSKFADSPSDYQSTIWHMAQKFGSSEQVDLNLLRYVDYKRWRKVLKAINTATKDALNNPDKHNPTILDFIARKEMVIKPWYGSPRKQMKGGDYVLPGGNKGEETLRFNDAIDAHSVLSLYNQGLKVYKEMVAAGTGDRFRPFVDFMAKDIIKLKEAYVNLRNKNRGLKRSQYNTVAEVEKGVADSKDRVLQLANTFGVSRKAAERYYDYYMLSSIFPQTKDIKSFKDSMDSRIKELKDYKKRTKEQNYELQTLEDSVKNLVKTWHQTSFHRYPFESNQIKKQHKIDFLNSFGTTFDFMRGGGYEKATDKPILKEVVSKTPEPPKNKQEKDQNVKEKLTEENKEIFNLFDIKAKKPKDPLPDDISSAMREIADIFNGFPSYAIESVSDMFTDMVRKRDGGIGYGINMATFRDVKNFRDYLRDIESARPKDDKMGKFDLYLFHSRQAEKQFTHDFSNPFKQSVPYWNSKGEWEMRDIRIPMGTMQFLQNSFGSIYKFENVLNNIALEDRDSFYGWKKDILDMKDGTTQWYNLHRSAMANYLKNAGEKPGDQEYYKKLWLEHQPLYDKLKDRIYKINIDGKTTEKTGEDVMNWIASKNEERYKKVFDELVKGEGSTLPNGESIWSLVDVYDYNGPYKPDYKAFNKHSKMMKFDPVDGKANLDQLFNKLIRPIVSGNLNFIDIIKKNGFISNELIYRMQYEYALEEIIRNTPSIKNPKRFREEFRSRNEWRENTDEGGQYLEKRSAFKPIGEIKNKYWPHMLHGETKKTKKEIDEYISREEKI